MSVARCECGETGCEGPEDGLRHACGGPAEACGVWGCPECGGARRTCQRCAGLVVFCLDCSCAPNVAG
jgi:hypothetical protein